MRVNLFMQFNAPDDYEPGDCQKCPFASQSYYENHQYVEEKLSCIVGYTPITCPAYLSTNDLLRQQCEKSLKQKKDSHQEYWDNVGKVNEDGCE